MRVKFFKRIRFLLEYGIILVLLFIFRSLPFWAVRGFAWLGGSAMYLIPGIRKLVAANIKVAFPELSDQKIRQLAMKSLCHTVINPLEFIWMTFSPERIKKHLFMGPEIVDMINGHHRKGEGIIFVCPHLGNWEVSALALAVFTEVQAAIVVKETRNPYLNRIINKSRCFDKTKVIFAKGAVKGSLKALRDGMALGILIDQNTRARDGGIFLNFFGLPVSSSPSPAVMAHKIKNVYIYCGTTVRVNGTYTVYCEPLSKPLVEYADDRAVVQELTDKAESYIRRFPEQYLWFYKRFQYIPPDADDALKKRYPYYAIVPPPTFFSKINPPKN